MVCSPQSIRYHVRGTLQCVTVAKPRMGQMPYTEFMTLPAALKDLGRGDDREMGRWLNNRAENSHLAFRRRERAMLRFRRMRTLQKLASVHASVRNHFPTERHLQNRDMYKLTRAAALAEWRGLLAA